MRLVLLRHGQTTSNVGQHLDTAEPGASLTGLGREQAQAVVQALADQPVDTAVVSTLVRTHETAAPFLAARGLTPVERRGVREVQAGDLEMRNDGPSIEAYVRVVGAWLMGDLDVRMPGGETGREVLARFDEVVAELATSGSRCALVVSHGAILRFWSATRGRNVETASGAWRHLSNTGVIVLDGDPDAGWLVRTWEDDAIGGPDLTDVPNDGPTG